MRSRLLKSWEIWAHIYCVIGENAFLTSIHKPSGVLKHTHTVPEMIDFVNCTAEINLKGVDWQFIRTKNVLLDKYIFTVFHKKNNLPIEVFISTVQFKKINIFFLWKNYWNNTVLNVHLKCTIHIRMTGNYEVILRFDFFFITKLFFYKTKQKWKKKKNYWKHIFTSVPLQTLLTINSKKYNFWFVSFFFFSPLWTWCQQWWRKLD